MTGMPLKLRWTPQQIENLRQRLTREWGNLTLNERLEIMHRISFCQARPRTWRTVDPQIIGALPPIILGE